MWAFIQGLTLVPLVYFMAYSYLFMKAARLAIKIVMFGALFLFIDSMTDKVIGYVKVLLGRSLSTQSLDLGWLGCALGVNDFLFSLVNILSFGMSVYLSAMMTILTIKYYIILYKAFFA